MARANREACIRLVLKHEGGYTNNPADPGGPTNFGITIADYRRYIKHDATAADVRDMHESEAIAIYIAKYWDAMRCGDLPAGLDYVIFDYAVNSGVGRAARVLRDILGLSAKTCAITDDVIIAAAEHDAANLITGICGERLHFLKSLRTWPVFGRGWNARVADVERIALAMAAGHANDNEEYIASAPGRGVDPQEHGRVALLQRQLLSSGFDPGAIDGDLGPKTIEAFQLSRGLKVDGIVGPITRPLLDAALAAASDSQNEDVA